MSIIYSTLINIGLLLIFLFCSYLLFSKLRIKKFFPIFLIIILATSSFFISPLKRGNSPDITPEMKKQIAIEQINVSAWYNDYKKDLTQIDVNWQQYHKILTSFTSNEISIQILAMRLSELEKNTTSYTEKYAQMQAPANLSQETENIIYQIISKTKTYLTQQDTVIKKSIETINSKDFKPHNHQEQVQYLEKIMILDSPTNLDISTEISQLKNNLTIPDEK